MSTNSLIAIREEDGKVQSVYCHWDGYLDHNGKILLFNYNSQKLVRTLLAMGSISSLQVYIGEKHDATKHPRPLGFSSFHARDYGEALLPPTVYPNVEAWLKEGMEYNYLYIPGMGWHVQYRQSILTRLSQAIANEEIASLAEGAID